MSLQPLLRTTPDPNTMVQCRTDRSCGGSSVTSTIKNCCDHDIVEPPGLAYTIPGTNGCQLCPVDFGFSQSLFSGHERGESYKVQVKLFSGAITTGFLFSLSLDLSGTASGADITLRSTRGIFLPRDKQREVEFSLNVDSIAQESNETFALTLLLSSTDQFGAGANIRNRLEGVIIDSDVTSFELTTAEYFQNEEPNALMEVSIVKSSYSQLANPVYLRLTPLTVGDALSRGVIDSLLISEFIPENNIFSPNRANYNDFDNSVLYVEFPTDRDVVEVNIPIVDDDVDEADEQVFIIFLDVMRDINRNNNLRINRATSIGRIKDDEITRIGFERQSYQITEPNPLDENLITNLVYLIRENNQRSEQTYSVDLTVGDPGENFKPATIETYNANQNFDYSFGIPGRTKENVLFPSTVDRIPFTFSLNPDFGVEGTETFRATSAQVTPSGDFPFFLTPTGVTAFATTLIHILDNDVLTVGFEELSYSVSESAGTIEVCVIVISPPPTDDMDVTVALTPNTIDRTAVAGSDFTQLTAFLSVPLVFPSSKGSPTAGPRRECFDVSITNDNMDENTESFSLLLQEDIFTSQTGATINPNRASVFILDDD